MPNYTQDDCRALMNEPKFVRNVVLLADKDVGKTTLMDNLGARVGFLGEEKIGTQLFALMRADEKEKKSNIKANPVHMVFKDVTYQEKTGEAGKEKLSEDKTDKFMMCVIDTPGHVEYSPEVNASLRICDGALMMAGASDGVTVSMEYRIADAIKERVLPSLFISKIDTNILTLQQTSEEIYQCLSKSVQSVNVALNLAEKLKLTGYAVDPTKGNVIFGSALYGWAFSLQQFARMYAKKMPGMDEEKMMTRLWGDQFFNASKKTWTKSEVEGSKRGFCQFIMDPIVNMHNSIMAGDAKWETMCDKLGVPLKPEDKKLEGKALLKRVMMNWLNAGDAVTRMMATHLPDPLAGNKAKVEHIYKGESDSDLCKSMIACDPAGPLMYQCVKLTPTGSAGRFYAVGRVFSGTMKPDKYHIRAPDFDPEDPETSVYSQDGRVQSITLSVGREFLPIMDAPAGNIVNLTGISDMIGKTATLTSDKKAYNFNNLSFNVSAVVRVAIRPVDNKQLPKLVEGLKRLTKSDLLVTTKSETTGDHIIGGCGEEHLKTLLKDLKEEHAGVDFTRGVPTISYKETCTADSSKQALSKSPNKHNRLYVVAAPLGEEVSLAIETYQINMQQEAKKRARIMIDEYGWEKTDCMKIWSFGPTDLDVGGANVLVDQTKGIQYLNEIKESVNSGLQWASREGPLAEENMRSCRFNLLDVKLHADSIHRGMGQLQPTARRVFYAAVLMGEPRFMEPFYKVCVTCPEDQVGGVRQAIAAKRGEIQYEEDVDAKKVVVAFLPIAETLGNDNFAKVLQAKTSGKAFATYAFDHWTLINTDPLVEGSRAAGIMLQIRERKGLKVEPPVLADYYDRL